MIKIAKLKQKYAHISLIVLTTLAIWLLSKWYYKDGFENVFKYPAKAASLTATVMMCWAIILSARLKFIEHYYKGLDKVYQVHKNIGIWAFIIILLHPFFLALEKLPAIGEFIKYFWFKLPDGDRYVWGENLGILALLTFISLIVLTIGFKLKYHIWKKTHEYMGLLMIIVLGHIIVIDGDIAAYPLLKIWMYAFLLLAIAGFIYIRFLYKFLGPRFDYIVSEKQHLGDVLKLTFSPVERIMDFKPSQFVYLVVNKKGISKEPHPYSIACGYNLKANFMLGIRQCGDYTRKLEIIEPGDSVTVYGPYGMFSDNFLSAQRDCIFIGGGIGITPFLGMWHVALHSEDQLSSKDMPQRLRVMHPEIIKTWKSPRVSLFYVVRDLKDVSFDKDIRQEIDSSMFHGFAALESRGYHYELHSAADKGLISADYIKQKIKGDLREKYIFLCGPLPMVAALIKQFKDLGVSKEHLIVEDFNLV
ncbi:MAG: ferric reductase-like transmembrane domain-containing protein [Candidatus Omnitrophica bacterium]|nr:ferric reductase-like transmembrane domain-containing protein [Candidatus Omnitrophota bacterium]